MDDDTLRNAIERIDRKFMADYADFVNDAVRGISVKRPPEPPPTERHACKDCRHHRTAETLQHDWFNGIVKGNMHLCAANTVVSKAWNPIEGETECEAMSECRLYNRDGHCTQFEWREDIAELERLYKKRTPRRK